VSRASLGANRTGSGCVQGVMRSSLALVSTLLVPVAAVAADAAAAQTPVRIHIDAPKPGEALSNDVHQAPIRGSAMADGDRPAEFDIMIVIDVSGSTRQASGIDVDGDGAVGFNPQIELVEPGRYPPDMQSTDAEDTILAAEVKAAEALIHTLDPERVRVGVISFSGEMDPDSGERMKWNQQDAWLDVPLTSNHEQAVSAVRSILARGPHGGTNFAAGIRLAVRELAALSGSKSPPKHGTKKVILFLTDGLPTFPIGLGSVANPGDTEAALSAARLAHKAGITMNTYALGPNALTNPIAATEMARLTLGNFLAVQNPGDIISFLQGVTFANIEDVVFTNLTTREVSTDVDLSPDGSFHGFVPVREGVNHVRITALASDGSSGSVDISLVFETSGLSERELTRELGRIRERNKHLMLLLERERIQEFRDRQRKVLEFEVDEKTIEGAP